MPEDHLRPCKTCNSIGLRCQENPLTKDATGVSGADFVLYVSAIQTLQCGETIGKTYSIFRLMYLINCVRLNFEIGESETVAYAAHCQQEADLDRPIAGHTNICPSALNSTDDEVCFSTH